MAATARPDVERYGDFQWNGMAKKSDGLIVRHHCNTWPLYHTRNATACYFSTRLLCILCCLPGAQPRLKSWGGGARFGPNTGAPVPRARLGRGWVLGAGGVCPLLLWESGGITSRNFLKTQMLNPAFWWLLAVKFLAFWKLRHKVGTNTLLVPQS